jgi:hypothetical protein
MTLHALVEKLHAHGVTLRLVGDRVRLVAPTPPPPELVAEARRYRAELRQYGALLEYAREWARVERCGSLAGPCPLYLRCPSCGAHVWRPPEATRCLRCEDVARLAPEPPQSGDALRACEGCGAQMADGPRRLCFCCDLGLDRADEAPARVRVALELRDRLGPAGRRGARRAAIDSAQRKAKK